MSCTGNTNRTFSTTGLAILVAAWLVGACSGPTNPEPILMEPQAITLEDRQGSVAMVGRLGAITGADSLQIVDLQLQSVVEVAVSPDGSFNAVLPGVWTDSFRLTARRRSDAATAVLHLSGDPNGTAVPVVVESLGCLSVSPTDLDLGRGPAGEPLHGELRVTNGCPEPAQFLQVTSSSPHFTVASLLTEQLVEPGATATVSVTFMGPGGAEEAVITLEPVVMTDPTQVPLVVTVRATALP